MRRSLLVEAFDQLIGEALVHEGEPAEEIEIAAIREMRFLRSPAPGDQLVLTVELLEAERAGSGGRARCRAEIGGELAAEGEITFERAGGSAA
jgi:3-hydroxymyristoyl/3-hydroxydecanoyl-(acyl carrier protein) dehydratase